MRARRHAEDANQANALVVDHNALEGPFILVEYSERGRCNALQSPERFLRSVVKVDQVDKDGGDPPQFREPLGVPVGQSGPNGTRQVGERVVRARRVEQRLGRRADRAAIDAIDAITSVTARGAEQRS